MILDQLSRLSTYSALSPHLAAAVRFVNQSDLSCLGVGRINIDGENVYANNMAYDTKPAYQTRWESHRNYIDIQIMIAGSEKMAVANVSSLTGATPYEQERDVFFYDGVGLGSHHLITVAEGEFAIFFPHDGHMPMIMLDRPAGVRKIVIKVAV